MIGTSDNQESSQPESQTNGGGHKRERDDEDGAPSTESSGTDPNKRVRTNHVNTNPSKVIHIRNVPLEATEGELYTLCAPFGKVETAVIMRGKGQALVQMQDQIGASALVDFYSANPAMLRTNLIYLQYSTREEITNKPPLQVPGGSAPGSSLFGQGESAAAHASNAAPHAQPPPPGAPEHPNECRVLLVNVANVQYPVNIDLLYSVFCKYGMVTKIVTFSKSGFQAFVQFSTPETAEIAKNALDGQNIYVGCCSLRINFSNIKDLDIKYNNDKSRDFTNPYLPRSSQSGPASESPAPAVPAYYPQPSHTPSYPDYGGYGATPSYSQSQAPSYSSGQQAYNRGAPAAPGSTPVIIVSSLNEEKVTPDNIFTLFGVYGDVLKVKILFNKKDTALVQMASPQQAEAAIANLNSTTMFGRQIRVNFSKHATIMLPSNHPSEENPQFTKEYVGSPLHRFRNPSTILKHVCPPSATLHVSSVPPSVAENELRELFSSYGEVVNVKFFSSEKRMALVQMAQIADAISALIFLHNHRFPDANAPMRVSFAKSTIYPS